MKGTFTHEPTGLRFRNASTRRFVLAEFLPRDGKVHVVKRSDTVEKLRTYRRDHFTLAEKPLAAIVDTHTGEDVTR